MAAGRRRDEWHRWGQLLALIDNRTQFGDDAKPSRPLDWWPDELVSAAIRVAEQRALRAEKMQISIRDLAAMMLGNRGRKP